MLSDVNCSIVALEGELLSDRSVCSLPTTWVILQMLLMRAFCTTCKCSSNFHVGCLSKFHTMVSTFTGVMASQLPGLLIFSDICLNWTVSIPFANILFTSLAKPGPTLGPYSWVSLTLRSSRNLSDLMTISSFSFSLSCYLDTLSSPVPSFMMLFTLIPALLSTWRSCSTCGTLSCSP